MTAARRRRLVRLRRYAPELICIAVAAVCFVVAFNIKVTL